MSYNIDSVTLIHSKDFSIEEDEYYRLKGKHEDEYPECSIFDGDAVELRDGRFYIKNFWWSGERSGHSEELLREVLAEFDGEADLILTWEGGDSFTGLRLRDNEVVEHEVVMALGEETKE
jgi:hypothetical protein